MKTITKKSFRHLLFLVVLLLIGSNHSVASVVPDTSTNGKLVVSPFDQDDKDRGLQTSLNGVESKSAAKIRSGEKNAMRNLEDKAPRERATLSNTTVSKVSHSTEADALTISATANAKPKSVMGINNKTAVRTNLAAANLFQAPKQSRRINPSVSIGLQDDGSRRSPLLRSAALSNTGAVAEVAFSATNITATSMDIATTMNEHTSYYYFGYATTEFCSGYTQDEMLQMVIDLGPYYEDFAYSITGAIPNTAYSFYVIPYDSNGVLGTVVIDTVVTLTQGDTGVAEVALNVSNITATSMEIATTMNEHTSYFYFGYSTTDFFADYTTSEIELILLQQGMSTEDMSGMLVDLMPGVSYTMYILPYNSNGEQGVWTIDTVTTLTQGDTGVAEVALTVSNITATSFDIATTMNDQTAYYYFAYIATADFAEYTDADIMQMIEEQLSPRTANFSETLESLSPNTSYTLYVLPYNANGEQGTVVIDTLQTDTVGTAEVSLAIGDITAASVSVSTTKNEHTSYYYIAWEKTSDWANYTQDDIIQEIVSQWSQYTEDVSGEVQNLIPGTSYTLYVLPYNLAGELGVVVTDTIVTLTQGDTGTAAVAFSATNITATSMDIATTMNDQTNYYYYAYAETSVFAGLTQAEIEQMIVSQMSPYAENISGPITGLTPSTSYTIYIFPYNANGELGTVVVDTVVTQELQIPSVTITADSTTATTAYLSFDKNDATAYYAIVLDREGLVPMLMEYGYTEDEAVLTMFNNDYYEAIAYSDTSIVASDFVPSSTNTAYALAVAGADLYTISSVQFTMAAQGGAGTAEVTLSVSNITTTGFEVSTTMNDQTNYYYFAYIETSSMSAYTQAEVIQQLMETTPYATNINATVSELLPGTSYSLYVLPVNANGVQGAFVVDTVVTLTQGDTGVAEVALTVSNVTATSMDIATTMNDQTNYYYFAYIETADAADLTQAQIEQMIVSQLTPYTDDISGTLTDLTPGTSYALYVLPYNSNDVRGTVVVDTIVTLQAQGDTGVAEVALTVSNITATSFDVATTMNTHTSYYYFGYAETSVFANYPIDTIEQMLQQMTPYTADIRGSITDLMPGTSYSMYILPYNGNGVQGTLTIDTVVTLTQGDTGIAEVALTISNIADTSFDVATAMNAHTSYYYFAYVETADFAEYTQADIMQMIVSQLTPYTDDISGSLTGLTPGTSYSLYVLPYNSTGVQGTIVVDTIVTIQTQGDTGMAEVALTVSNITATSFDVATTMNTHTDYYYFGYATTDFFADYPYAVIEQMLLEMEPYTNDISGTLTDLIPGTSYTMYILPYDSNGVQGTVTIDTVVTLTHGDTGTAVVTHSISNVDDTSFYIAATMNDQTNYYYIAWNETSAWASYTQADIIQEVVSQWTPYATDISGTATGLTPGTSYTLYILPYNANGVLGTVVVDTIVTTQTQGDTGMAEVALTVSNVTATSFDIATTMNTHTSYYYFGYAETSVFANYPIDTIEQMLQQMTPYTADISGSITELTPGTSYTMYVLPYNGNGVQGTLTIDTVVTLTQGDTGVAEVALTISNIADTSFDVATAMNAHTSYYYFACIETADFAEYTQADIMQMIVSQLTPYTDDISGSLTGLTPGTSYSLYVLPYNSTGVQGTIVVDTIVTIQTQGDTGVAEVALTVSNVTATSFDVATTMNTHTSYYYFGYVETSVFANYPIDTIEQMLQQMTPYTDDISGSITELTPGTSYTMYILPYNGNGVKGTLTIDTVETLTQGDTGVAEVALTISNVTSTSFDVAATMNAHTSYYYMAYAEASAFAAYTQDEIVQMIVSQQSPYTENVSVTIDSLTAGTTYMLCVLPYNADGVLGVYTTEEITPTVSIDDAEGVTYNVFPNPATSELNVEGERVERVELYNALGQRVISKEVNGSSVRIDVNDLVSGAYILRVYGKGEVSVQKVVIK